MKIALVVPSMPSPSVGASDCDACDPATHVPELGAALAASGHRVVIYSRKDAARLPRTKRLGRRLVAEYVPAGPPAPLASDDLPKHARAFGTYLASSWSLDAPDIVDCRWQATATACRLPGTS